MLVTTILQRSSCSRGITPEASSTPDSKLAARPNLSFGRGARNRIAPAQNRRLKSQRLAKKPTPPSGAISNAPSTGGHENENYRDRLIHQGSVVPSFPD